jgi:hypothetical protein
MSSPDISPTTSAPSSPTATEEEVDKLPFRNVPWVVRPSPGINYDFVVLMYLAGSVLAVLFFGLEKTILAQPVDGAGSEEDDANNNGLNESGASDGEDKEVDPWTEFAKGFEGMYYIFVPFIPCLLWSLVVRYFWMKESLKMESQEKKVQ